MTCKLQRQDRVSFEREHNMSQFDSLFFTKMPDHHHPGSIADYLGTKEIESAAAGMEEYCGTAKQASAPTSSVFN